MNFDEAFDRFSANVVPSAAPKALAPQLRALARLVTLPRRQTSSLDASRDHFVYICGGSTKLVALDASGSGQILSFQFGSDCLHMPRDGLHAYRLVAMRRTDLLVFDAGEVRALAAKSPQFGDVMAGCTLTALHRARENLVAIGRRSATERVASFLLAMREIEQVTRDDGRSLDLVMTRREIADSLGLTVETVSRQFSKLRAQGVIATPSRTLVKLTDPTRLAAQAGSFAPAA